MKESIDKFVKYASSLDGDEKGEAQVFCDRLFQAFGHDGYKEAGATLEFRVKSKKKTNFADLLWGDRVLIEMKKKGAQLNLILNEYEFALERIRNLYESSLTKEKLKKKGLLYLDGIFIE